MNIYGWFDLRLAEIKDEIEKLEKDCRKNSNLGLDNIKTIENLEDVIERLKYKAWNMNIEFDQSYYMECVKYLRSLPIETNNGKSIEEYDRDIRNKTIDEFAKMVSGMLSCESDYIYDGEEEYHVVYMNDVYKCIQSVVQQMKGDTKDDNTGNE